MRKRSFRQRSRRAGRVAICSLAAAAALLACSGPPRPGEPGTSVGQAADAQLPATVRDTTLVSSTGARFDLAQLAGKVVVISDMMTLCQETCPLDTANVVAAARAVQRAGLAGTVAFLSITIDPVRDTVARLAAYRRLYSTAPADWQTATGAPVALARFWRTLGVYIQQVPDTPPAPRDWLTGTPLSYDLTHSDEVFFFGRGGHERFLLDGAPHVVAGAPLPTTIRRFMDAQGRQNLAHPDSQAWTLPQELQVISWLAGHRITAPTS